MKKNFRNFITTFIFISLLYCLFTLPVSAASSTSKGYLIKNQNTTVYSNTALTKKYGTVYGSDEITILKISSKYTQIKYPVSGGTKTGYISTSALFTATSGHTYTAKSKITTYKRPGGSTYGYIAKGDSVLVLGTYGNYTQVRYPVSGGYKFGFVTTTNCNKYIKGVTALTEVSVSNGTYTFISALSGSKVMDVSDNSSANETNIQLWTSNSSNAQKFTVTKLSNGWYSIKNVNGKSLDVYGGKSASGVNVQLYSYHGGDCQQWKFYSDGSGYYYIQNKLGYYLDVSGGTTTDGTNIQVYSLNYTSSQKWKLSATSVTPTTETYYVTTTAGLVLRKSASASSSKLVTMPYGASLQVSSISNGWAACTYNGKSGYCNSSYISKTPPSDQTQYQVQARLDQIKNGTLSRNSGTVMKLGSKFTGTLANEQCKGYAKNVFYLCFKIMPGSTKAKPNNHLLNSVSGMKTVGSVTSMTTSNIKSLFSKARIGDFVQMRRTSGGSHSAIVYAVSSTGVTFLECNLDGKNTVSQNTYTWSQLCKKNAKMSVYTASSYSLK